MRDTTASVVVRALQADIFVSLLEIASTAAGYIEGTLSQETAISVAGFSAVFASFGLWILNHQARPRLRPSLGVKGAAVVVVGPIDPHYH